MPPDRRHQISDLYHAALARPPAERDAFVKEACSGDERLRQEVESLLQYESASVRFLETPAAVVAAPGTTGTSRMVGRQLGPYQIVAPLGVGGMGEVYRAHDTKLGRDVAIKILPAHFSEDPERRARFAREARLLATLNHPHIGAIYGLEEADGLTALVLELVEGPTLADRLDRGPLPIAEAVSIARQIADALEAAHEKGIVHRDLKPANIILLGRSGSAGDVRARVLDFGLAKAMTVGLEADPTQRPSGSFGGTVGGRILGTPAYMSPEQARGLPVDKRTDIWAFGCVLFEMLTGRRAFRGDSVSDTLAAVLTTEVEWARLPAELSPGLRAYLQRCLHKDPNQRIHDIADVRLALEGAFETTAPVGHTGWSQALTWPSLVVAAVTLLVGVGLGHRLFQVSVAPSPGDPTRLTLPLYPGQHLASGIPLEGPLGLQRPSRRSFVLSPDGRQVIYAASDGATTRLYVRALDQFEATPIPGTEGASSPFVAPDGASVGFFVGSQLKRLSMASGDVRTLTTSGPDFFSFGASWTENDSILLSSRTGIYEVPSTGGGLTRLVSPEDEGALVYPQFLPGSRAVLFNEAPALLRPGGRPSEWKIVVQALDTGKRLIVERGSDPRYIPSGHIVFARTGTLMAVPFDVARLEAAANPVVVAENVMHADQGPNTRLNTGAAQFDVSRSGSLAYVPGGIYPLGKSALVWIGRNGVATPLPLPQGRFLSPRLSPDGTRLAYVERSSGDLQMQIWVYDIGLEAPVRLTASGFAGALVWNADSTRVAFVSPETNTLVWMDADGRGKPQPFSQSSHARGAPSSWSRDNVLAFTRLSDTGDGHDIWTIATEGGAEPKPFLASSAWEAWPVFSPDGRWLAYASDETGRFEVYVRPFPAGEPVYRVSTAGGVEPVWSDQRQLIFLTLGPPGTRDLMAVDVVTTDLAFRRSQPRRLFAPREVGSQSPVRGYDLTPDGRRFVSVSPVSLDPEPVTSLHIVQNWFQELKRFVPTR